MKKVLIINDCRFESIIMRDIINNLGYDARITNEYGALKEVENFSPNIIIVNLIMKETTGDKLISKVKSIDSNIYGILSSCNKIKQEDYSGLGVDAVIQTPIDKGVIEKVLIFKEENNAQDMIKIKFKFCPYCGKKLEHSQYKFCPFCGNKI